MNSPTRPRFRRAARQISLVLIGTSAIVACSRQSEAPAVQDRYASLEDCAADWGRPEECQARPDQASGTGHGFFYGPWYYAGNRPGFSNRAVGSVPASSGARSASVSRGGFGSTGHAFGAGG
ncbi:hypothetical protein BH09PSE6_BH09PSE6_17770 [soil metagenome]